MSSSSAASKNSAKAGHSAKCPASPPRICGICPVSHLLASAKAGDDIHGGRYSAGRRKTAPTDEPGPDCPDPCPEFLPPERAGLAAGLGYAAPAKRNVFGLIAASPNWLAAAFGCANSARKSSNCSAERKFIRPGPCPAACAAPLTEAGRERIIAWLPEAVDHARTALKLFKSC